MVLLTLLTWLKETSLPSMSISSTISQLSFRLRPASWTKSAARRGRAGRSGGPAWLVAGTVRRKVQYCAAVQDVVRRMTSHTFVTWVFVTCYFWIFLGLITSRLFGHLKLWLFSRGFWKPGALPRWWLFEQWLLVLQVQFLLSVLRFDP